MPPRCWRSAADDGRQRPVAGYADVARHEVAARRRSERYGSGRPHPPSYSILEPHLEHLRVEMLVQVKSAAGMGTAGYRYTLTDAGRDRALRYFEACGVRRPCSGTPSHECEA